MTYRVYRGGSWYYTPLSARVAFRGEAAPGGHGRILGLRLAKRSIQRVGKDERDG